MDTSGRPRADFILTLADQVDLEALAWGLGLETEADCRFYESILRVSPGLALEAGCGGGRLLLSLLRSGFQVEGCDISSQMLLLCRNNAVGENLNPTLHHYAIQDLPFTERYSVIILACGTFMCITDLGEADRCLRTLSANLIPGGRLVISIIPPSYLHLAFGPFPTAWEDYYQLPLPNSMGDLTVDWRAVTINVPEQVIAEECRYRWLQSGQIHREEVSLGKHRWYRKEQLMTHLHNAGFQAVKIYANYSHETSLTDIDVVLTFVATRDGAAPARDS
jgi:SAM-dependent methyltransferase